MGSIKIHITLIILLLVNPMFGFDKVVNDTSCSSDILINEAFLFVNKKYPELVSETLKEYMAVTGDFEIINHSGFEIIKDTTEFNALKEEYGLKFKISTFFYLYVGLIGIFISVILNFRRKSDRVANGLISAFVFMHSFFLIHLALYLTNYVYRVPHTQSMSTWLSFLYGPVLYFYFKRVTTGYNFKLRDCLHLLPTVVYFFFFLPIYGMSGAEKLMIMMDKHALGKHPYIAPVTYLKFASLVIYGVLTFIEYYRNSKKGRITNKMQTKLQYILFGIHAIYTISYSIYGILITRDIFEGWLFDVQLLAMTSLVLYIGYVAYSRPKFLSRMIVVESSVKEHPKYKNSGLTTSLSRELWIKLQQLMENDKLYRQNNIKLETIADLLGTTRHNASQIINEHSGLNFFELINQYRIEEAKQILSSTTEKLNIIDIAYEVGYNNKVTFNKSFKRFSNLTPSQYRKQLQAASASA